MLVHAASGGKAAAAVPAYLRQHHPTLAMHTSSSTTSLVGSAGAGNGTLGGVQAAGEQPSHVQGWPSSLPRAPPAWHGMQASTEAATVTVDAGGAASWAPGSSPQPQPEQPQPVRRTSSFGARTPARRHSSSSHEHWHPPSRMYSEDDLQAAEAAAALGRDEPQPAAEAMWSRSRSSSSSSLAAAAADATAGASSQSPGLQPPSRRASSVSLGSSMGASPGPWHAAGVAEGAGLPWRGSSGSLPSYAGFSTGAVTSRPASAVNKIRVKLRVRKEA